MIKFWEKKKSTIDRHIFLKNDVDGKALYQFEYLDSDQKVVTIVLKHIYTDKAGKKFYQFGNPIMMTMERQVAASAALKEFQYNMTSKQLLDLCDAALQANNARDYNTVALKVNEIKTRALRLVEYDTTMKLGAIYFLYDDEHPGRYNPLITNRKLDIWKEDDEARGFFLKLTWDTLKPYSTLSSSDLWDYLVNRVETMIKPGKEEQPKQTANPQKATGSYNILKF